MSIPRATIVSRLAGKIIELCVDNELGGTCLLSSQLLLDGIHLLCGPQEDCVLREGYFVSVDGRRGGRHYWLEIAGVNIDLSDSILNGLGYSTYPTILVERLPMTASRTDFESAEELETLYAAIQQHGSEAFWQPAPPNVKHIRQKLLQYAETLR